MGEKKLLKLSDWSKGMITAVSRVDLPPDALFYAENLDLSIPMRQGLLEQDAMVGGDGATTVPKPHHNTAAETYLGWEWLDGTPYVGDFARMNRVTFAGKEYIWKLQDPDEGGTQLYFLPVYEDAAAWTQPTGVDTDIDPTVDVFGTGKNLLITLDTGEVVSAYDGSSIDLTVGNKILTLTMSYTATEDLVYRTMTDTGLVWVFRCVKTHEASAVVGTAEYIPDEQSEFFDATSEVSTQRPFFEHWQVVSRHPDIADALAKHHPVVPALWSTGGSYTGAVASVSVSVGDSSYAYTAATAIPVEYDGNTPADSGTLSAVGWSGGYNPTAMPGISKLAGGGVADWPDPQNTPTATTSSGLLLGGYAFLVEGYHLTSPLPGEYAADASPAWNPDSLFMEKPYWEKAEDLIYYSVYEYEHGGFSKPKELFRASVESAESSHQAIGIQLWHTLNVDNGGEPDIVKWPESVRRVHVFRVTESADAGTDEAWLFAADREDSSWLISDPAFTAHLLSPAAGDITAASGITGNAYGGSGPSAWRVRYQTPGDFGVSVHNEGASDKQQLSAISDAFINLAAEGITLSPSVKAGVGLFSYVDLGQPITDTASQIMGISIADAIGSRSVDTSGLDMKGAALGRAFYGDGTTGKVYYSEPDRYTMVDPLNYMYFQGAGEFITASSLHSYLIMFFKSKTVIMDARSGLDVGWSVVKELDGIGCAHADTITRYESTLFWMGSGSVWQWSGNGDPQRISAPIEYPEFEADMKNAVNMWCAVDPAKKELLVYMDATAWDSGYAPLYFEDAEGIRSKCLVYSIGQRSWTVETFRAFAYWTSGSPDTQEDGYVYLGKPFELDNLLLIPCRKAATGDFKYLVVRQAYTALMYIHDSDVPIWKRAALETGFMNLGAHGMDKKLKRIHATFTAPRLYGAMAIEAELLDHWKLYLYQYQDWEDQLSSTPWESLADQTADYEWDVADEDDENATGTTGYHRSHYVLNNIPSRQSRYVAIRLESASTTDPGVDDPIHFWETTSTKSELGELSLSFATKEKF
jgi:hypothetical protein